MSDVVSVTTRDNIAFVEINSPPVNSLGIAVRAGILAALDSPEVAGKTIVIRGANKIFSAGADIGEFATGRTAPFLRDVLDRVDSLTVPVIAAIDGVALGGGLELALACSQRVATPQSSLALPEITLGLIPGAGGTVRLPRLVGATTALGIIASGRHVPAREAEEVGLVDAVLPAIDEETVAAWLGTDRVPRDPAAPPDPVAWEELVAKLRRRAVDPGAFDTCVAAIQDGMALPTREALDREGERFAELLAGEASASQRYLFGAERHARRNAKADAGTAKEVRSVAVIGGGTMGSGIALACATRGLQVTVIEPQGEARARAQTRLIHDGAPHVNVASELSAAADADLVIEAVFEDLAVKHSVFTELDRLCRADAILATNTSYLDVVVIASVVADPSRVLGLHFFSPANVMKLVEVVDAAATSPDTLATGLSLVRAIGKIPVVTGVCYGFAGNRMLARRSEQAEALLLEGALPGRVDDVVTGFGFRMGPFGTSDLAGLDIGWRNRQARGLTAPIADQLVALDRLGQKTGQGFYRYDGRSRSDDPVVDALIVATSTARGITRRDIPDSEILDRMLLPLVNEGARILAEDIVTRGSDLDVIWRYGYNWPATSGGPMRYADRRGLSDVVTRLEHLAEVSGDESLHAAPLLRELAESGLSLAEYRTGRDAR